MSIVTNVILHIGIDDERLLAKVNKFFTRNKTRGFVSLDDASLPRCWYGGTKYLEGNFSVGAFNHLSMPELLEHIRGIQWHQPEAVQLIVLDQEDYKCRIIEVFPDEQALYEQQEDTTSIDDASSEPDM